MYSKKSFSKQREHSPSEAAANPASRDAETDSPACMVKLNITITLQYPKQPQHGSETEHTTSTEKPVTYGYPPPQKAANNFTYDGPPYLDSEPELKNSKPGEQMDSVK